MQHSQTLTAPEPLQSEVQTERALEELLSKDTPENFFGVFYMLLSFLGIAANVILVLFVDSAIAFPICFALYAGIAVIEIKNGIYSPVTLSLVGFYVVAYLLYATDDPRLTYAGLGLFAWLSLVCLVCLLIRRPITTFYANGHGAMRFHLIISNIWFGAFVLSFISSFLLMPSVWYLLAPFLICISACLLVVYLSIFDLRFVTRREKEFTLGDYTFRQLSYPSPAYEEYAAFYSNLVALDTFQSPEKAADVRENLRTYDEAKESQKYIFGAYDQNKLVGCIGIATGGKGSAFPFEEKASCSLEALREMGALANVGRLGIAKEYRERTDVLRGLTKAVMDVCLERDVVFMFSEVLAGRYTFHARIGFSPFLPRAHPRHRISCPVFGDWIIFFNNLSHLIFFYRQKAVAAQFGFSDILNAFLVERWVKRTVLRHVFAKVVDRPWMHTIASVRYLLGIHRAQASAFSKKETN